MIYLSVLLPAEPSRNIRPHGPGWVFKDSAEPSSLYLATGPSESMAETAGPSGSPPVKLGADQQNPMRKTKPGLKRLSLTLTVLFSFLFGGSPPHFLRSSTEIYRSPLPFQSIESLSSSLESNPLSIPCRFQAMFVGFGSGRSKADAEKLGYLISEEMRKRAGSGRTCGGCGTNFTVSVAIDSGKGCARSQNAGDSSFWRCGAVDLDGNLKDSEAVDEIIESGLVKERGEYSDSGGRLYSVVVINREEETTSVVGKYRHGWIIGRYSEPDDAVSLVGKIFVEVFMNGGMGEGLMGKGGEFMPVGADGSIVLSFSLLNADPGDWIYDWDFQKIEEILLAPVVEALSPIANVTVESQVNSNEWHLDTSLAAGGQSKVLQFVVYIPSAKECPLLLRLSDGTISATNGFISPMWGGVIVWNPPACSGGHGTYPLRHTLLPQELQMVFQVLMGQLRLLLGLRSDNIYADQGVTFHFLASARGFADCLSVQSLPRMIVMDEIGKQVKLSLQAATLAQRNASGGIYDASAVSSRQARALAEDAFFHPSIMSLSYSSIEHYFAIYMPFFAPVTLHVLLAVIKELKRFKQERSKYLLMETPERVPGLE
ncbi:hypothetical protein ACLOJK_016860 [Asimina triloba]